MTGSTVWFLCFFWGSVLLFSILFIIDYLEKKKTGKSNGLFWIPVVLMAFVLIVGVKNAIQNLNTSAPYKIVGGISIQGSKVVIQGKDGEQNVYTLFRDIQQTERTDCAPGLYNSVWTGFFEVKDPGRVEVSVWSNERVYLKRWIKVSEEFSPDKNPLMVLIFIGEYEKEYDSINVKNTPDPDYWVWDDPNYREKGRLVLY